MGTVLTSALVGVCCAALFAAWYYWPLFYVWYYTLKVLKKLPRVSWFTLEDMIVAGCPNGVARVILEAFLEGEVLEKRFSRLLAALGKCDDETVRVLDSIPYQDDLAAIFEYRFIRRARLPRGRSLWRLRHLPAAVRA